MLRVLHAEDDTDLSGAPRNTYALRIVYTYELIGVMGHQSVPVPKERSDFIVSVRANRSHADVHHIDPRVFKALKVGNGKTLRIGKPGRTFIAFDWCEGSNQGERIEHVDDNAALEEIDGTR